MSNVKIILNEGLDISNNHSILYFLDISPASQIKNIAYKTYPALNY